MASIKPIVGSSVHQIQSGQVIVDLCSVVKELVENSLDAQASSIEVRFKNNGLDSIEVQDNGSGIAKDDYESIALKHYTSKLSTYDDLGSLNTFGFRGEALSSLCAVSNVYIITARDSEVPKGTRLDFETSGKLKGTRVVASQRGTTVAVETVFKNLPVRRQELERNIKREYNKVLGILQAYACISTNVKFSVSNIMPKGKKVIVFSTRSNKTTRDNIANVYGAKTLSALVDLDLSFDMESTNGIQRAQSLGGGKTVSVVGHVSKPIFGEGRQTPDRQMFFVNSRPCRLPQVAKVMNEVYRSYNLSQSPFIFANVRLDTNAYDVNVSPDKRTILLHDQGALLESLRTSLTDLFESQDQTVPQSQVLQTKSAFATRSPLIATAQSRSPSISEEVMPNARRVSGSKSDAEDANSQADNLIHKFFDRKLRDRHPVPQRKQSPRSLVASPSHESEPEEEGNDQGPIDGPQLTATVNDAQEEDDTLNDVQQPVLRGSAQHVVDFNARFAKLSGLPAPTHRPLDVLPSSSPAFEDPIPSITPSPRRSSPGIVPTAFERMRPLRAPPQIATITIGDKVITSVLGSGRADSQIDDVTSTTPRWRGTPSRIPEHSKFSQTLKAFTAKPAATDDAAIHEEGAPDFLDDDIEVSDAEKLSREDDDVDDDHNDDLALAQALTLTSEAAQNPVEDDRLSGSEEETFDESDDAIKDSPTLEQEGSATDPEYVDDIARKEQEDAKVAKLIRAAEEKASRPTQAEEERANHILNRRSRKDATFTLTQHYACDLTSVQEEMDLLRTNENDESPCSGEDLSSTPGISREESTATTATTPEERLSLTVTKSDFAAMRIVGQFNLGFIIAVRPAHYSTFPLTSTANPSSSTLNLSDDLFIIDQHASDEKSNFERLQATTTVQSQRLVHPLPLSLTAIEEEIVIENQDALLRNGFTVKVKGLGGAEEDNDSNKDDKNEAEPIEEGKVQNSKPEIRIGERCSLLSLPLSKELTFSTRDLEELIALLAESPSISTSTTYQPDDVSQSLSPTQSAPNTPSDPPFTSPSLIKRKTIPRPSKVRRMLAMRACRSSIMIGKSLTKTQMSGVVRRMGELEKPWNCPHGRPTMRHLAGLGEWRGWGEGEGEREREEEG
ncbi:hypothetical protein MMC25_005739 [Agyrium rufum]|nr:hypothetical protein [Agyrium rufum]